MKRLRSFAEALPTLYLVATPIGNLEDITYRAVKILNAVDKIYCEDTRTSRVLLDHYHITQKLDSYHDHNEAQKQHQILKDLTSGLSVALISDAGHPLISDPGYTVVKLIKEHNFPVVSIPGPSAFITGLSMSALPPHPFMFYGFLSSKSSKQRKECETLRTYPYTMVFYESPHRIQSTLETFYQVFGNRNVVIARELTKTYEETISGSLEEMQNLDTLKGELVVILEGYQEEDNQTPDLLDEVYALIDQGVSSKEAIKVIAKRHDLPKNDVYQLYHKQ
ncbi:MAG: 16S rRNA (cytidine(1402)-2'-O)-methyltransferase [Candidatus Izimaplasma sp.]|nr:16S rRNA (cytidine(1402)-2'-O)-methyltransferase [Candidatus Izimaplasma bacterium]